MMNPGSLSSLARLHPGLLRVSRLLVKESSLSRQASSLPSSPVRTAAAAISSPHHSRRPSSHFDDVPSSILVASPLRRPFSTIAHRAIGSSTADINSNSSTDSSIPPPPPLPGSTNTTASGKKSPSDLLDEALASSPLPPPPSLPSVDDENALIIADSCVKRLKEIGEERLRVVVEGGGCSGFQYKFELSVEVDPEADRIFKKDGVEVVVDESSLELIRGSVVEFHTELIRSAFRIAANPLAEKGCSCGASFSVKF